MCQKVQHVLHTLVVVVTAIVIVRAAPDLNVNELVQPV